MRGARLAPGAALLAAVALAGCSGPTEAATAVESPSAVKTAAAAKGTDLTAQVQEAVGEDLVPLVTAATQTEPGRVEVATSITDPRTDDSTEAGQALDICTAASGMADVAHVSVLEADGTTFVVFGHPSFPAGECSEV